MPSTKQRTIRRTLIPPPDAVEAIRAAGHSASPVEERFIVTTVRLRQDHWEFLKRAAVDHATQYGGRPDSSEVLREILDGLIIESLDSAQVESPSALTPKKRDAFVAESLALPEGAPMDASELKRIREALGLSQGALARRLDVDVMTISRKERGVGRIKASMAFKVRALAKGMGR